MPRISIRRSWVAAAGWPVSPLSSTTILPVSPGASESGITRRIREGGSAARPSPGANSSPSIEKRNRRWSAEIRNLPEASGFMGFLSFRHCNEENGGRPSPRSVRQLP